MQALLFTSIILVFLVNSCILAEEPLSAPPAGIPDTPNIAPNIAPVWHTDLEEAITIARKEHKDIYLLFTGSDWCPSCVHLKNRILQTADFYRYAMKHYVCVILDFPRNTALPKEQTAYNETLRRKYGMESFPTALMLDEEGIPYAIVKSSARNAHEYLARLDEVQRGKADRDAAFRQAEQTSDTKHQLDILHRTMQAIAPELRPFYNDILQKIDRLDPGNKLGYKGLAEQNLQARQQQADFDKMVDACRASYMKRNLVTCVSLTEDFLKQDDLIPTIRQKTLIHLGTTYIMGKQLPIALEYLKQAYAMDPDSAEGIKLKSNIDNLQHVIEEQQAFRKKRH